MVTKAVCPLGKEGNEAGELQIKGGEKTTSKLQAQVSTAPSALPVHTPVLCPAPSPCPN